MTALVERRGTSSLADAATNGSPRPRPCRRADDLDEVRDVFETVSDALIALDAGRPGQRSEVAPAVYQVYCPMVKKSWLQPSRRSPTPTPRTCSAAAR